MIHTVKAKGNHLPLATGICAAGAAFLLWTLLLTICFRAGAEPRNGIVRTVKFKGLPATVVAGPDGRFVYFSDYYGMISVIDAQNNRRTQSRFYTGGSYPILAISPDSQTLYASIFLKSPIVGVVEVISAATLSLTAQVQIGDGGPIVPTPDGKELWVYEKNKISIIDTATNQVSRDTIPLPGNAADCVFTPDGTLAYVCYFARKPGSYTARLALINTASRTVIDDDIAGRAMHAGDRVGPIRLALNPTRGELDVVVETADNQFVMAINTSDYKARTLYVPLGQGEVLPMCATPDGKFLYLAVDNYPDSPLFELVSIGTDYGKICGQPIDGLVTLAMAIRPDGKYLYLIGDQYLNHPTETSVTIVDIKPEKAE